MRTKYINAFLLIVALAVVPYLGYGQTIATDSIKNQHTEVTSNPLAGTVKKTKRIVPKEIKYPHLYWGFTGNYGIMDLTPEKAGFDYSTKGSMGGGLYFELRVTKWLGIETGGNYWVMKGDITQSADYATSIEGLVDSEGDEYNSLISAVKVSESWSTSLIEIPFALKFQLPVGNWTFYLKPGASYNMVTGATYNQDGIFSRSGYYSENNITFENLPSHGFYEAKHQKSSGSAFTNFINPFVGFGIIFPAASGNLFMEAKYYPGSLSMAKSGNGTLFEGPENLGVIDRKYQFESVTEESGKITLSGLSFSMGFRF